MAHRLPLITALLLASAGCGDESSPADGANGGACRLSNPQCDSGLVCSFGTCSPGTPEDNGRTAQDTTITMTLSKTTLNADGADRITLQVLAQDRNTFEPLEGEELVISANPSSGAVVVPGRAVLIDGRATFELVACDPTLNRCPEQFLIHASFAEKPLDVVATTDAITLIDPNAPEPDPEQPDPADDFLPTSIPADSACQNTTINDPLWLSLESGADPTFASGFAISAAEALALSEAQNSVDLLFGGTGPNSENFSAVLRLVAAEGLLSDVGNYVLFDRDEVLEPPADAPGYGSLELEIAGSTDVACLTSRGFEGQSALYLLSTEQPPVNRVRRALVEFEGVCDDANGIRYVFSGCLNYDINQDPRFTAP
ncbi:MAG: hypothetical protein ACE366_31005 [Bradymonadia bacterium]